MQMLLVKPKVFVGVLTSRGGIISDIVFIVEWCDHLLCVDKNTAMEDIESF